MIGKFVIHWKPIVDSTNTWAKLFIQQSSSSIPHVFLADYQTAGRGRLGRSWIAPPKTGVLLSIAHQLPEKFSNTPWLLGQCGAYVVIQRLQQLGIKAQFKWPNDVWTQRGKICGILPEAIWNSGAPSIVIGIGINVGMETFPSQLRATSIKLEIGKTIHPVKLGLDIARAYISMCIGTSAVNMEEILQQLNSIHILKDKTAIWDGRKVKIGDISPSDGGLWIKDLETGREEKIRWGKVIRMENGEA